MSEDIGDGWEEVYSNCGVHGIHEYFIDAEERAKRNFNKQFQKRPYFRTPKPQDSKEEFKDLKGLQKKVGIINLLTLQGVAHDYRSLEYHKAKIGLS